MAMMMTMRMVLMVMLLMMEMVMLMKLLNFLSAYTEECHCDVDSSSKNLQQALQHRCLTSHWSTYNRLCSTAVLLLTGLQV